MVDFVFMNTQLSTSQDVNWWTGVDDCDVFIICLDSHSDGTHSLQSIHWWASDVMLHFRSVLMRVNTVRRKEVSCSHLFTKIKWAFTEKLFVFFEGKWCLQVRKPIKYESPMHGYSCSYVNTLQMQEVRNGFNLSIDLSSFPFPHSDGTHSLQRIHWRASDVMLHFSKSVLMKKQTHLMAEAEKVFIFRRIPGWTIPLNSVMVWFVSVNQFKLSISMNQFGFCSGIFMY